MYPKKKKKPNLGPFFSISGPQKTQFPLCNLACSTGQGAEHVGTLHVCMCPAFPVGTFAGIDPAVEVSVCSLAFYETLKPVTKKSGAIDSWNAKEVESLELTVSSFRIVSFLLFQSVNAANS